MNDQDRQVDESDFHEEMKHIERMLEENGEELIVSADFMRWLFYALAHRDCPPPGCGGDTGLHTNTMQFDGIPENVVI